MNKLTFSFKAIQAMREAGWRYYPARQRFEYDYYRCSHRDIVARDISDFTGYDVSYNDTCGDKGYWYVCLSNDDECFDFAVKYDAYYHARRRIKDILFNRTLLLTREQYDQVREMMLDYDKKAVGDYVMIAIPKDETTKRIFTILDALGI